MQQEGTVARPSIRLVLYPLAHVAGSVHLVTVSRGHTLFGVWPREGVYTYTHHGTCGIEDSYRETGIREGIYKFVYGYVLVSIALL